MEQETNTDGLSEFMSKLKFKPDTPEDKRRQIAAALKKAQEKKRELGKIRREEIQVKKI